MNGDQYFKLVQGDSVPMVSTSTRQLSERTRLFWLKDHPVTPLADLATLLLQVDLCGTMLLAFYTLYIAAQAQEQILVMLCFLAALLLVLMAFQSLSELRQVQRDPQRQLSTSHLGEQVLASLVNFSSARSFFLRIAIFFFQFF